MKTCFFLMYKDEEEACDKEGRGCPRYNVIVVEKCARRCHHIPLL
jgi:hypothetical protein